MISLVNKVCDEVLDRNLIKPYESFDFSYASARLDEMSENKLKMKSTDGDLAPTLTASVGNFGFAIPIDIPVKVKVRKYEVDTKLLAKTLREHKKASKLSNADISDELGVPITLVEHWFRNDKFFAIPQPEIWYDLKKILHIDSTEFDDAIMTFEIKDGVYDKTNRCYSIDGISPTLLAQTDGERIIEVENSMNDVKLKVVGSMSGGKWDNIHESCRRVYDADGLSPTLNTQGGGNQEVKIVEKEYNSCDFRYDDGLRIRANGELSPTITTRSSATMSGTPMVVEKDSVYTDLEKKLFTEDGNIKRYLHSDIVDKFEEGQMATTTFPNGYDHGPRTHNESVSLNTIDRPSVKRNLRIRKLTPKECWRLMGFSNRREDGTWDDSAFERASKVNSNAQLYKQAGNSIVVDCLEAIFTNLFLEPDHTEYREISLF